MLLCCRRAHQAEGLLRQAIREFTAAGEESARTSSELRLVQVLQRLGRVSEAVALARRTLARQEPSAAARHYALQHLGKAPIQAGAYTDARAALAEALAVRQSLAAQDLVLSTSMALSLLPSQEGNDARPPADGA
jgi:tetratricopeptide (TPR) repeat protein